jgi:undecaprenyl-diphosphatase
MPEQVIEPAASTQSTKTAKRFGALTVSLIVALVALLLFAWLSNEMLRGATREFDANVRVAVHAHSSRELTRAMLSISLLGSPFVLTSATAMLIVIFLVVNWHRAAAWMAIAMVGAALLETSLKHAFGRPRPAPFFGVLLPRSASFPSGHALASFCFFGVLAALLSHRLGSRLSAALLWIAAAVLIAAIGFSRIYLGVHYATDVIAGYLAAAIWVAGLTVADRYRSRWRRRQRIES